MEERFGSARRDFLGDYWGWLWKKSEWYVCGSLNVLFRGITIEFKGKNKIKAENKGQYFSKEKVKAQVCVCVS